MKAAIQFVGVEARYGKKRALSDVSFEAPVGSVTALVGSNGAGKSTLIRMIVGLERARAGKVLVGGLLVERNEAAVRRRVGYVPDQSDVYPWMKLRDYFDFLRPHYPSWSPGLAQELAHSYELDLNQRFRDFSRGQKTKAMLAAALTIKPELLLLDEPFGAIDPVAKDEVLRGIIEGVIDNGCSVFVATHDLEMAARIADRVVVLEGGRVRVSGLMEDVLRSDVECSQVPRGLKALIKSESRELRVGA